MYNTVRNEMQIREGKRSVEKKIKHKHQLTEEELIGKIEQMLNEKKLAQKYFDASGSNNYGTKNNLNINGDEDDGIFRKVMKYPIPRVYYDNIVREKEDALRSNRAGGAR